MPVVADYRVEQVMRMHWYSFGYAFFEASRSQLGVTEQTYYRWRKEFGGMQVNQAKRLKELEKENSQLKRLVAELNLDKLILEEAARGNF